MRAIHINPHNQTVSEVEYSGDYHDIYKLIDADLFTVVYTDIGDIFVDDEGLFKGDQAFFWLRGTPQPLAGHGLVLASDDEGETIGCTADLEYVRKNIVFGNPYELMALAEEAAEA